MKPTKNTPSPPSASSGVLRVLSRRPGLTLAAMALTGVGLGFRQVSQTLRENERAQTNAPGQNLYVSVERSGGGI